MAGMRKEGLRGGKGGRKGEKPDLESCGAGFKGVRGLKGRCEEEKKEWKRVGKGLRGKIFRESFGKPPDRQIRQGPPSQKAETATHSGAITYPLPPPCLRPYVLVCCLSVCLYILVYRRLQVSKNVEINKYFINI